MATENYAEKGAREGFTQATSTARANLLENGNVELVSSVNQNKNVDANYDAFARRPRTAWHLYTEYSKMLATKQGISIYEYEDCINFYCNPSHYAIDLPFRQSEAKAKGGPVLHTFRDVHRQNTNLDFGTINITFETGSILPRKYHKSSQTGFPEGLGNYFKYLEIVQQDRVYRNDDNEIVPNYIVLEMNTLAFPNLTMYLYPLDKTGHTENADNPSELTEWVGNFKILKTEPSIFSGNGGIFEALRNSWKQSI